jgi:hypothetical protein
MPRIDLIPEVLYDAEHVYHHHMDNLPLKNINARTQMINTAVDQQAEILRDSKGNQSDLASRLDESLESDGSIKTAAVDDTLHNIGSHTDGEYEGVSYVRMTESERDKLELIADEATNISVLVGSTTIESGLITIEDSTTIEVELVAPRTIKFNSSFGTNSLRLHYYDIEPAPAEEDPDYITFLTNISATPFAEGSLRVFVNGIRLSESASVLVYGPDGPSEDWVALTYVPTAEDGAFELSRAIDEDDIIRIDFDTEVS